MKKRKTQTLLSLPVSGQMKDEDLLRGSEENFRRMFEEAPIGMALTSSKLYFLLTNRIMTRMFGYSEKELKQLTFKDITHPDHLTGDIQFVNRLIGGELEIYRTEKRYIRKNKEIIWGSLTVTPIRNTALEVDHFLVMVEDITERKKNEMMLKESQEQLESFAQHLQTIREEERARVSRELHDTLGQNLSAIRMDAASIIKKLGSCRDKTESKPIGDLAKEMMTLIDATIPVVRKISSDLRPRVLDELGLLSAIEWQVEEFIKRSGIPCELIIHTKTIELKYSRSIAVFRIVQESLTNIMRHAGAAKTFIKISENKDSFVICVQDNGSGIRGSRITSGKSLGLIEMRERALLIGGNLVIRGTEGKGTEVELTIPKI
jgi:PAS domain S-box-containing protein